MEGLRQCLLGWKAGGKKVGNGKGKEKSGYSLCNQVKGKKDGRLHEAPPSRALHFLSSQLGDKGRTDKKKRLFQLLITLEPIT